MKCTDNMSSYNMPGGELSWELRHRRIPSYETNTTGEGRAKILRPVWDGRCLCPRTSCPKESVTVDEIAIEFANIVVFEE